MPKATVLTKTAERLNIEDNSVIKKAEEFLRVFQAKASSLKSLNDIAKTIFCLDLSCRQYGISIDKEAAIKLSGLKKSIYQTNLHTVEKVLGLDKCLTISDLCVQFNCTEGKDLAKEILNKYKESSVNKFKDTNHPQYVATVVYIACKLKGIKVDKSQFIQVSRIKPPQWKELVLELENFVKTTEIGYSKKKRNPHLENNNEPEEKTESVKPEKKQINEELVEDYEVWKKRILKEAYTALGIYQEEMDVDL